MHDDETAREPPEPPPYVFPIGTHPPGLAFADPFCDNLRRWFCEQISSKVHWRMPRRQVRRPDKSIDLSGVLRETEALPEVLTSQTLFGNDRPLEIEVGSGKGLFLATASGERPEHNFLGIEIARPYAMTAAARVLRSGRSNVLVTPADAGPLFESRVPDRSLMAVHVYFPDPWWKKKHKKRRVLNEAFLKNVSRTLAPGGRFHFWTDVLEYFETVLELAATVTPELGPPIPEEASEAEHDLDYRTHFERRSRKHAIPVYRIYWNPQPAPPK